MGRVVVSESMDGHELAAVPLDAGVLVANQHTHNKPEYFTRPPMVVLVVCWVLGCWILLGGAFMRTQPLDVATDAVTASPLLNTSRPSDIQLAEVASTDASWPPLPARLVELRPCITGSVFGFSLYTMLTSWQ